METAWMWCFIFILILREIPGTSYIYNLFLYSRKLSNRPGSRQFPPVLQGLTWSPPIAI